MKVCLVVVALCLVACNAVPAGPPVVITVVSSGAVLPVEAQRVIDQATATAASQATQSALATATGISARETSTAAAQGTLGALVAQQTQVALQLTAGAGAALATEAAGVKTQAAADADAVRTQSAVISATQLAAAGQLIALDLTARAAKAAAAATHAAADAQKASISVQTALEMGKVMVGVAGLAVLALAALAAYYAWRRHEIRLSFFYDIQEQRAEQARAETQRAWAESVRASTIEHDGRPHLITPRGYVALLPAPITAAPQPNLAHEWRWRAALKRAVLAGIEKGLAAGTAPAFGERDLAGRLDPVIVDVDGKGSSAGYRAVRDVLVASGIWLAMARKDTVFAPGWDPDRFAREFDTTPLLSLPAGEPPLVRIPHRSSAVSAATAAPQAS